MMDTRPKTAVLHQYTGIGDLVWHIPYFEAVARQSHDDKVAVIAQPSTSARQLLKNEPWVGEIIDHDHRPRRSDKRPAQHAGISGMVRMGKLLKSRQFDRIILFSGRPSRGLIAQLSGIPQRLGYGYHALQRLFLNVPPYISRYEGNAVAAPKEMAAFAIAHGFCTEPLIPRLKVGQDELRAMGERLRDLTGPIYAFAIGTSELHKQWGAQNFAALAQFVAQAGGNVLLLGGPSEATLAQTIIGGIPLQHRHLVLPITDVPLMGTAAALEYADVCIGNDTGVVSIAAACECPTFVLLGDRPLLEHDPLISCLVAPSLARLTPEDVWQQVARARIGQRRRPGAHVPSPRDGDRPGEQASAG
ncbi:glycosyltransferase family 9 protein [Caldimonas brevitalea]|uniref:Uncharacterized protein n=1 Tax=Caldimonas brevitalea TaxID=413882 RepID=A0A0G3BRM0_9BURK|nr:glycosyltransferase family 9 protein [Caldimonas brevitalea]AKJ30628.1 hypothetical protein AAW51_3937 [Caldimonas brevitalea]